MDKVVRKVIAIGIPLLFVIGFIDATHGIFTGMYGLPPVQVADKLGVHPSIWRAVGCVNGIHVISWTVILIGVLLGKVMLVRYVAIFAFGMYVTDLMLSVPMWDLFPKPGFRLTALITILFQFAYLLSSQWLLATD